MAPTKGVANRRKSIAVTSDHNDSANSTAKRKRRAHSIAPGERLSPVSKARRSIAPRKSILKASLNFPGGGDDDDSESTEATRDFTTDIRDNTTQRAIFARRVSFAEHAHVRLFKKDNNNTNSTASPQSSPAHELGAGRGVTDENAYPGSSAALGKRRSSVRRSVAFSEGELSMEVDDDDEDAVGPSAFMFAKGDSAVADDMDENGEEEYDDDDMDMTEAISQNIIRKRSLSLGGQPRRPLSNVPSRPRDSINPNSDQGPSSEPDRSYTDENSTSTSLSASTSTDPDRSQPLEYTVPLIKPPAPPSDAWLALRSVTHSGDTPYEAPLSDEEDDGGEQGMELTNAVQRLLIARQSLSGSEQQQQVPQDDSFASTNDSFDDDDGNQTINVTGLIHRASMGAASTDAGDSTMDVTGDYGAGIVNQAGRLSVGPVHPQAPPPLPSSASKPRIFSAPPLSPSKLNKSPAPAQPLKPFSFTPASKTPLSKIPSPSKIPTPVFSAAPAARSSPKKRSAPADENQNLNESIEPEDRPSPAKKVAVAGRWPDTSAPTAVPAAPGSASKKTPSRLSPSKKAPFLAQQQTPSNPKKSLGSVRRPSGYFAQRKSLVPAAPNPNDVGSKRSPKKAGRMSAGHGNALVKFDVAAEKEKAQREKEARERQVRSGNPARASPAPQVARPSSTAVEQDEDTEMQIVNPAAQWREDIQEQSFSEDDSPPISIEQFFNMTGIRFMDEITAPRRSTIHPSALRPRRHSSPSSTTDSDIPLAEYVTAMSVDVPQLELYTYVSKDLEAWIERSKGIFREAEAEAEKITPELFREFVCAGEDGQAELLHQLKLIKANTHGNAKSEWYDWKLQWVEQLFGKAQKGFADLTEDAKALEVVTKQAQALVPSLREEYEQVMSELEQEKALVAEIESSDHAYLSELKNTIAEQNAELEAFRADVSEGNAKLERLEEKLHELDLQKQEATSAIDNAQRLIHIQKNSTRAEVFRLKDELESLENLHLWHAVRVHPDMLEFIYASMYRVSIPCIKFRPVVEELDVWRMANVTTKFKDAFPQLSDLMLRMAKRTIIREKDHTCVRKILQRLGDYWSSCAQLRSQLKLVAIKYPLSVKIAPLAQDGIAGFSAVATIMFPNIKAKALISFILDMETFSSWPMSIGATKCEVEVAYGPIERNTILDAVMGRMGQATPAENHACLLDACIEAMDQYV